VNLGNQGISGITRIPLVIHKAVRLMVWKPVKRTGSAQESRISRRRVLIAGLSISLVSGCKLLTREKPDELDIANAKLKETLADPDRLRLINEVARVSGATPRRFESLGLVTNLPGTGGVVKPSPQREMMLQEIRRNDILDAERVLDAPTTATAKLSVIANPCDDKGDLADVLVECSAECEATDLREGHLMEAHLFEYFSFSDSQLRKSHERATAKGDILVYPASYSKTCDQSQVLLPGLRQTGYGCQGKERSRDSYCSAPKVPIGSDPLSRNDPVVGFRGNRTAGL